MDSLDNVTCSEKILNSRGKVDSQVRSKILFLMEGATRLALSRQNFNKNGDIDFDELLEEFREGLELRERLSTHRSYHPQQSPITLKKGRGITKPIPVRARKIRQTTVPNKNLCRPELSVSYSPKTPYTVKYAVRTASYAPRTAAYTPLSPTSSYSPLGGKSPMYSPAVSSPSYEWDYTPVSPSYSPPCGPIIFDDDAPTLRLHGNLSFSPESHVYFSQHVSGIMSPPCPSSPNYFPQRLGGIMSPPSPASPAYFPQRVGGIMSPPSPASPAYFPQRVAGIAMATPVYGALPTTNNGAARQIPASPASPSYAPQNYILSKF